MFDERSEFRVVVNPEEQYSIWPAAWELPAGWRALETTGSKTDCLAYIDEVWTDLRPLSLRRQMAAGQAGPDAVWPGEA